MKSILQDMSEPRCFLCGATSRERLDKHHVFFGTSGRAASEKYGLTVLLCHRHCHLDGVHADRDLDLYLKRLAQKKAMRHYGWDTREWLSHFNKNFLTEDDYDTN